MKTRKPIFKDFDFKKNLGLNSRSENLVQKHGFNIIRLLAFADANPQLLKSFPEVNRFVAAIVKAAHRFEIDEKRIGEERRIIALVQDLDLLYKKFRKNKTAKNEQMPDLKKLVSKFSTLMPIPLEHARKFTINPTGVDVEIRGERELATLKVSTYFGISKSGLYKFSKASRNVRAFSGAIEYLDVVDLEQLHELLMTDLLFRSR